MRSLKFRKWVETTPCYFNLFLPLDVREGEIVEQYTGLKDKNGKEIYEGDIVECSFGESGAVEFRHGAYCVVGDDINDMSNWKETAFEVIGNIHENPELLEEK